LPDQQSDSQGVAVSGQRDRVAKKSPVIPCVEAFTAGLLAPGVGSTACEDINHLQSWRRQPLMPPPVAVPDLSGSNSQRVAVVRQQIVSNDILSRVAGFEVSDGWRGLCNHNVPPQPPAELRARNWH
jgi:hypothetical protein